MEILTQHGGLVFSKAFFCNDPEGMDMLIKLPYFDTNRSRHLEIISKCFLNILKSVTFLFQKRAAHCKYIRIIKMAFLIGFYYNPFFFEKFLLSRKNNVNPIYSKCCEKRHQKLDWLVIINYLNMLHKHKFTDKITLFVIFYRIG